MAKKETFSAEEWNLIRVAPVLVMTGVAAADPGGLIGAFKESFSGVSSMMGAFKESSGLELMVRSWLRKACPPCLTRSRCWAKAVRSSCRRISKIRLGYVKQAVALVKSKGSPEEAAAYEKMMAAVAEKVANAAKEGGFLGSVASASAPAKRPSWMS